MSPGTAGLKGTSQNGEASIPDRPKALLAWSSGKDSAWALQVLGQSDEVEVVGLLTTVNQVYDRIAMHAVRSELLMEQAKATGLSLREVLIPSPCSNEAYESAMSEAIKRAKSDGISLMAFGDLFLEDVRRYREERLEGTGVSPIFPIWGMSRPSLSREMVSSGRAGLPDVRRSSSAIRLFRRACIRCNLSCRSACSGRSLRRTGRVPHVCLGRADVPASRSSE